MTRIMKQNPMIKPPTHSKVKPRKWTKMEDTYLLQAIEILGPRKWSAVAKNVPGRTATQCMQRWCKVLSPGLIKGNWNLDEDEQLKKHVKEQMVNMLALQQHSTIDTLASRSLAELTEAFGEMKLEWSKIIIKGRTSKQCRERWVNNLNPTIKRGNWKQKEDKTIISLWREYPNRWSFIAKHLPGRTENTVKNRYKTLKKKGLCDDITPVDEVKKPVPPKQHKFQTMKVEEPQYLSHLDFLNEQLPFPPAPPNLNFDHHAHIMNNAQHHKLNFKMENLNKTGPTPSSLPIYLPHNATAFQSTIEMPDTTNHSATLQHIAEQRVATTFSSHGLNTKPFQTPQFHGKFLAPHQYSFPQQPFYLPDTTAHKPQFTQGKTTMEGQEEWFPEDEFVFMDNGATESERIL